MNNNGLTIRKSGVELLKLIAIIMICLSHCAQTLQGRFVDVDNSTFDLGILEMIFFRYGGTFGNIIFIVSSSYFLIDKNSLRKEKVVNLLLDSQMISVAFFVMYLLLLFYKKIPLQLNVDDFLNNIFPDLYDVVWFVPAYVVFYFTHPYINLIINKISRREHFNICLFIFIFYSLSSLIKGRPAYIQLLGFFMIYFIVGYIKLYCKDFINNRNKNIKLFSVFLIIFVMTVVIKYCLAFRWSFFEDYPHLNSLVSVFSLPLIICLFNIFLNMKFSSKIINYLSGCSLFVYCIHENFFVRDIVRPKAYDLMINSWGNNHFAVYAIILATVVILVSFFIAIIYRNTLHKIVLLTGKKIIIIARCFIDKKFDKINENEDKL